MRGNRWALMIIKPKISAGKARSHRCRALKCRREGLAALTVLISPLPLCAAQSAFPRAIGISHICIYSSALQHGQLIIITNHFKLRERGLWLPRKEREREREPPIAVSLQSLRASLRKKLFEIRLFEFAFLLCRELWCLINVDFVFFHLEVS